MKSRDITLPTKVRLVEAMVFPVVMYGCESWTVKIMASSPITSRQTEGGKVETVTDFIFLGSKITVDSDCSCKSKRCLLIGRKAMTILDSILKSRDITLLTKVRLVKAMVFPVVMYGCESWTIEKLEH